MTPSLDLFLQPEHLARLSIRSDGHLWYDCDDIPSCNECLEAGLVPSTRGDLPLFLSCTQSRDISCDTCPLRHSLNCSTFTVKPFLDFVTAHHPELLL